jgi:fructokinase
MANKGIRIGVDVGGTKIEALAIAADGTELLRYRVPTPHGDYNATIGAVAALVFRLEQELSTRATVGGGIALNGRVHAGSNGVAGEWGHNPLPWLRPDEYPGPACYCGHNGCIETWISGTGLARDHASVIAMIGDRMTGEQIVAASERGDAAAIATMARHEERTARALAHAVNLLDPDVIVIGGGLSRIQSLYANLPGLLGPLVFGGSCNTPIVQAKHGDSSGVRGAAWLWSVEEAIEIE